MAGALSRGMTKEEAAEYCGCKTLSAFAEWVRQGLIPGPMPGTHRWDRKAIDAALDRLSGLETTIVPASPLEEWRAKRARAAQGSAPRQEDAG